MLEGKTVIVEALEDHTYDGVLHRVGERYEAQADHVEHLGLVHAAKPVTEAPAPEAPPKKASAHKK